MPRDTHYIRLIDAGARMPEFIAPCPRCLTANDNRFICWSCGNETTDARALRKARTQPFGREHIRFAELVTDEDGYLDERVILEKEARYRFC